MYFVFLLDKTGYRYIEVSCMAARGYRLLRLQSRRQLGDHINCGTSRAFTIDAAHTVIYDNHSGAGVNGGQQ